LAAARAALNLVASASRITNDLPRTGARVQDGVAVGLGLGERGAETGGDAAVAALQRGGGDHEGARCSRAGHRDVQPVAARVAVALQAGARASGVEPSRIGVAVVDGVAQARQLPGRARERVRRRRRGERARGGAVVLARRAGGEREQGERGGEDSHQRRSEGGQLEELWMRASASSTPAGAVPET
jgi:hypothetical protein